MYNKHNEIEVAPETPDITGVSVVALQPTGKSASSGDGGSGQSLADWTSADVVAWVETLEEGSFEKVAPLFESHGVGGTALFDLDEEGLKEMSIGESSGITIGVRKRLARHIRALVLDTQRKWRQEIVWTGVEHRPKCCIVCPFGFPCCCVACVGFPASYRLSNARLSMVVRDGCCKGLCAPVVVTDNLDLAFVTDVDVVTYTPCFAQCCGWCCAQIRHAETGVLSISSVDGIKTLRLTKDEASKLGGRMTQSVEDAQLKFVAQRAFWRSHLI
mmetsp:Transcript_55280/g.110984  ORF Transcript_55280/g.110984 Transcript_55280/m.110984 type:complete len:273 (-) Transcript_55280:96-914(-)|eukprot:CAMPEP_0171633968 /NCGR_PEP_ID=MMETSP0990-20121206/25591_1 /TAXON_ID=483369 /ORGANISM="non described non described, Strain CCMP2098" /LENGTH=272 /DNA_ID=CAMNT_0012204931 /DNA_START=24 /DNA_END=842 /DNA_ORIENTATION=-